MRVSSETCRAVCRKYNKTVYSCILLDNYWYFIIITIIFLHGLGRLTCFGIDALPSFPGASTISSSSRFVVEGVFRESGVVHSFKVINLNYWHLNLKLFLQSCKCGGSLLLRYPHKFISLRYANHATAKCRNQSLLRTRAVLWRYSSSLSESSGLDGRACLSSQPIRFTPAGS